MLGGKARAAGGPGGCQNAATSGLNLESKTSMDFSNSLQISQYLAAALTVKFTEAHLLSLVGAPMGTLRANMWRCEGTALC